MMVAALALASLGSHEAAARDICISVKGKPVITMGNARCLSDSSSVAVAIGNGSVAGASRNSTAVVNGDGSDTVAQTSSTAVVNGDGSGGGAAALGSTAVTNGDGSYAAALIDSTAIVNGDGSAGFAASDCLVYLIGDGMIDICDQD